MSAADFALLFPAPGQDIEFTEDAAARISRFSLARFFSRPIPKAQVQGIHGTFFAPGELGRRAFFPTKRESDLADDQGVPPTQRALYAARRG